MVRIRTVGVTQSPSAGCGGVRHLPSLLYTPNQARSYLSGSFFKMIHPVPCSVSMALSQRHEYGQPRHIDYLGIRAATERFGMAFSHSTSPCNW